jgi:hypothetical protein
MKNIIGIILVFIILITACKNQEEIQLQTATCKSSKSLDAYADTMSCIEYTFNPENHKLTLKHINTSFNCCVDGLFYNTSIYTDTIIIEEFEKNGQCNCMCLYDMDIEINGLQVKTYYIKIIEQYIGQHEPLFFQIDLAQNNTGDYCVSRENYPWGLN